MMRSSIRVALFGDSRWVPILTEELRDRGIRTRAFRSLRADLRRLRLLSVASFLRANVAHGVFVRLSWARFFRGARRLRKRTVAHWIGSDLMDLRGYALRHKRLPAWIDEYVDVHLADSPAIQEELAELGIEARVIRLLPRSVEADVLPLPDEPAVLSYWQDFRPEFYGASLVLALARRLPELRFYVVGATGKGLQDVPANVTFLGEVRDMEAIYPKVSALFRFVQHDSVSAMVLETLARGRYVLYSHRFPHTFQVTGLEDAAQHLEQLCKTRQPNHEGASYVRQHFSWRGEIDKLRGIYHELLDRPRAEP